MAYNLALAERVRSFLASNTKLSIEEKKMFRGITFMVDGKMCVSISNDNLMCRFDPALHDELAKRKGVLPMLMKGREYKGYCYISEDGYKLKKDFEYWLKLCLTFNTAAKAAKPKRK
jgi:TfoX/Sxy family transcriptional regulator of competence genes